MQDGELRFLPAPANGRSGSAVFDGEGRRIVALLTARTGDGAEGIATPVQAIYRAFDCHRCAAADPMSGRPVSPMPELPQRPVSLLAALPAKGGRAASAVAGRVAVLGRRGGRRPRLQHEARQAYRVAREGHRRGVDSRPPAAPDYGPQIREAADTAKEAAKKADEAQAAIKPAIDESLKPIHEDLAKLKPAIELADKVQGKLDKLAELPGPLGKPAQKIEADLAAGNVDQGLRDAAKAVGAVLAVLGLVAAITLHLIGQHKGAIRVLADQLAAQNPNNTALTAIAQKIDSVEDAIAAKLPAGLTMPLPIPGLTPGAPTAAATGVVDAAAHGKADLLAQQVSQIAGQVGQLQANVMPVGLSGH